MNRNNNENEETSSTFTSDAIFVTDNGGYSMDRPFTDRHIPCDHHRVGSSTMMMTSKKNEVKKMKKKKKKKKKKNNEWFHHNDDAMTKAAFYGECASQGISFGDAYAAIEESQGCYRKWWLQQVQAPSSSLSSSNPRKVLIFCPQVLQLFHENHPNKKRKLQEECTTTSTSTSTTHDSDTGDNDTIPHWKVIGMEEAKMDLLKALSDADGDTTNTKFQFALSHLESYHYYRQITNTFHPYDYKQHTTTTTNKDHYNIDKLWFNMTKPTYTECLGKNSRSEYRYKLGRLSFDMFPSSHLVCSIQGMFNYIGKIRSTANHNNMDNISIPTSLRQELRSSTAQLRSFNIIIALTVESNNQDENGIKATLTNYGYIVPNPKSTQQNRWTTWFDRGTLQPNNLEDLPRWRQLFQNNNHQSPSFMERGRRLACQILLGATIPQEVDEKDGSLSYFLARPIGGHDTAYTDILYEDETLCVTRGQYGNVYVMGRQSNPSETIEEEDEEDEKKDELFVN